MSYSWTQDRWKEWHAAGKPCTPEYLMQVSQHRHVFPMREALYAAAFEIGKLNEKLRNCSALALECKSGPEYARPHIAAHNEACEQVAKVISAAIQD